MTEQEWDALADYVRWVANEIELRDWALELMRRPSDVDCYASIHPTYGQKHALIYVEENFRTLPAEKQRKTIVHELVHCHLESAANMVYRDVEKIIGKPADEVFYNGFKRQIEYGVDALAIALANHMPLIEWPEEGETDVSIRAVVAPAHSSAAA